jgi:nucleoside-diphosphate-sugar epimerase
MIIQNPIFVTGATGFIGSHLVRSLLKKGCEVHITVRADNNNNHITDILDKCIVHKIDLTNHSKVAEIVKEIKPQTLFHLAAYGVDYRQRDETKAKEVNIKATVNLFNSFRGTSFIHTSTASVYGPIDRPLTEKDPILPRTLYGKTKALSVKKLTRLNKSKNVILVVLRPFGIYGPMDGEYKLIPEIIKKLSQGQALKFTYGNQVRDYLFVDDLVEAYYKAAQLDTSGIFNVGSGKGYTHKYIALKIAEELKVNSKLIKFGAIPYRPNESMYSVANIDVTRKVMRWEPTTSMGIGIRKTLNWT